MHEMAVASRKLTRVRNGGQPTHRKSLCLGVRVVGEKPEGTLSWSRGRIACLAYQSAGLVEGTLHHCPANSTQRGGVPMEALQAHPPVVQGVRRRELLQAGLAAGITLSAWSLPVPPRLWGADA